LNIEFNASEMVTTPCQVMYRFGLANGKGDAKYWNEAAQVRRFTTGMLAWKFAAGTNKTSSPSQPSESG
jgi:hypothetical protein